MSVVVIPSAIIPTIVATGMRSPRMHGTPPICFGSTVIRLNFMAVCRLLIARKGPLQAPPVRILEDYKRRTALARPNAAVRCSRAP
jgi:hypothetical protein